MTTGHIMMAMSLDGFVARRDHALDWLMKQQTEGEDHGFEAFMARVDVIVMGSNSLRTVLGFGEWPYTKPVVTLSNTLTKEDIPDHLRGRVEISRLPPEALMAEFAARGYASAYVDGAAVIRSFLDAGLISDMKVTIVPILIGQGIRLFGELDADIDLRLVEAHPFPSGLVDMIYEVS